MSEKKHKDGITAGIPAPNSIKLSNAVEASENNYIIAQMRIEVSENGVPSYSLQTGPIEPTDSKALFFTLTQKQSFTLVIETNHVTTWTSTQWNVLHTQPIEAKSSRNFVVHGTPDKVLLHALSDA